SMIASFISEFRKNFTTKMWWILLAVMVVMVLFFAAIMSVALTYGSEANGGMTTETGEALKMTPALASSIYTMAVSVAYLIPLILGILSVTGEFRHRTIVPTFIISPRRGRVLAAKFAAI